MTDYIRDALFEMNPCGIRDEVETHCKYNRNCAELGNFLCISQIAYQLAEELSDGAVRHKQKRKLSGFLEKCLGVDLINPENGTLELSRLTKKNLAKISGLIFEKGNSYYKMATRIGNSRNPANFRFPVEEIIKDLY